MKGGARVRLGYAERAPLDINPSRRTLLEVGPSGRIDALFKKKTCAGVLGSVDKSNQFVNAVCITSAFVALLMFITAVGNACSAGETIIAEAVPVPAAAPADAAQPQGLHQD